jgi:hypothetical protein
VTRRFEKKIHPIFQKVAQKVTKPKKCLNIYNKRQFGSPKHMHQNQTIFETLKYLQQCFETAYLGENAINLIQQKVAQNVTISLGYFILSKKS